MIYPQVCGVCGKIGEEGICKKCKIRIQGNELYGDDSYEDKYFEEHIYLFKYNGIIRKMILDYKFGEKSYLYNTFMIFLKNNEKICVQIKKYDIIIPVPISRKRYKKRGYNQSSIIAKNLAKYLEIKCVENALIKKIDNKSQSTLNQSERYNNVNGVYFVKKTRNIINKNILLVDDILTTGSTANECSKMLKEAGANKIGVFTIAKD